jgi:amino acid adenylation domain-containing protein
MPFDLVVLAVKPQNDMSRTALFDVLFHYDRTPELQSFAGASVRTVDTGLGWGKYDLVLSLRPDPDGVRGSLVYNLELFAAATASRIAQRFVRLVESLVAAPEQRLKDVDLLLPGEFESILAGLRDIAEYPRDLTIHGAFEQVAAARAHATAIFGDRTLSYGELNRAANRLAHRLRRLGVAPDQPVGIMLGRCSAVPVAMLGILKAGAGYLPLDPDYPADRVRFMIEDSGTRFVVTDAGHAALVDAVATSVDISSLDGEPDTDPTPVGSPEALAYIIYTSGSTGQPKGVMIEHRNVIQLLRHQGMPFSFGPTDTWTWLHSPCFDFSVWEIFGPLLSGGRLVVVPASVARDPEALLALVLTHQATVLSQTPAAFYALTDAMLAQDKVDSAIAVVVLGGEALQPARLRAWRSAYPQTRLVNMYGITETTVHVTHKDIGAAEIADGRSAIGVPLPSYRIVIVDPELRLCPPGLPGEICVAGHGVGRSYLNRPDLDVARFVSLPGLPGRFYRSGDLGRLTVSGELIYLGRIDEQVKIRGFRIELGEIESHLLSHPQVRDAVVLADGAGGLTAWLVADRALTRDALIAHLGDKLPQFMVPSRFARIDAVPKTANGKVDRRRLAALDSVPLEAPSLPEDHPRSDLERALAAIWRELLDGAAIGRSDNFFELGGHSLKATQAVSRIRQRLGRSLSLKDFFSAPTLAALALRLEGGHAFTDEAALPAAPSPADEGYALSPAQRRLWLVQTGDPDLVNYNMVGAFTLEGALDPAALAGAFAGLVARHEALRTRFSLRRGQPRQRIDRAPESFHLPVERAAAADEAQAIDAALGAELSHVFSLESGPLLRVRLIRLPGAAARWLLVLNMHHIIADGWSVNVMLRDLEALYRAALGRGGGSPADLCIAAGLAALPLQYKDFAAWQHRQAAENRMTTARRYWVERFEDGGQVCELPTDRSRPAMPSFRGRIVSRTLDPILSQRLRDLALEYDASLFMVFAALVQLQLHLLSGQSDITIGTPVAGRDRVELEPQVGFYLNLLPIRVSVDGGASFTALLRSVRSAALDAFAHAGYPFDQLVEEVADQRGDRRNPLFDVMLILQNNQPLRLDLPGVAALPLADRTVSAKYDLNYMVEDRPTLDLLLEYAEELFDHRTVERIADEFIAIATSVIRNPRITPVDLAAAVMPAAGGLTADGRATVISAEDW